MSLLAVSTNFAGSASALSFSSEGAVNVDLDASFLVQVVLFLILLAVLKPLLFDPMMKLFEEREKRIEGTRREASKEDERSAKALAKYEGILSKAREAGNAEAGTLRADAAKKEAEIMARVRASTAQTLEQGRAAIAAEAKLAREKLNADVAVLGREMAARVLGREVSS